MTSDRPLKGLRVLDLTVFLPGPFCTQVLGDLGADVVKVEPPGGDPGRGLGSDLFAVANRNKRSIELNLKSDEDRSICHRLAQDSDVFVEGFRPGVVDRLGVGFETIRELNPAIIYCSMSGYGASGPKKNRPGHDITYLAASGALSFPGCWDQEDPVRPGVPVSDLAGSLYAATAILAAVHERERTSEGRFLDVALVDAALAFAATRAGATLDLSGQERKHLIPSNDLFRTRDDRVLAIGAVEEHFWEGLRSVASQHEPSLTEDRWNDAEYRWSHGDELFALLQSAFGQRDAEWWERELGRVDVPVEQVVTVDQAARSQQIQERGIVVEQARSRQVLFPVLGEKGPLAELRNSPPSLDQDRSELLRSIESENVSG